MTLPTSGPLSLADIQTEFGGTNPIGLNEYYAGGTYVPSGTTGTYGAVPTSGAISIQNFYGTSSVIVSLSNQSITSSAAATYVFAGYVLNSSGAVEQNTTLTGVVKIGDWVVPNSAASNYEVLATVVSGAPLGTFGSWLALSTTRSWSIFTTGTGNSQTCSFTVQIRRIGTTTVLANATINLTANAL